MGLTEEEFMSEMKQRHEQLKSLNEKAVGLEELIEENFESIK